VHSEVFVVG